MPVDYGALARQNGGEWISTGTGGVDYGALAQQHGGVPVPGTGMNRFGELDTGTELAPAPTAMQKMGRGAADLGIGVLKGLGSIPQEANSLMAPRGSFWNAEPPLFNTKPANTMQSVGKGIEQAGEFLIPGGAEEEGAEAIAKMAPKLKPLARMGMSSLGAGAVNKAQGGGFGSGAAMGAGGRLFTEGAKAVAPAIREFAQGIMTPASKSGRAMLEERLSGFRPSSIRKSAQGVLDKLNPELDQAAMRASVRPPARIAGLLASPQPEMRAIPLGEVPENMIDVPGQLVNASRLPSKNVISSAPDPRNIEQLGGRAMLPPARLTRSAYMTSTPDEVNELNRSGPGVLLRPKVPSEPPAAEIPYNGISLRPARTQAGEALNKANLQGEPKLVKGVKRLQKQLMSRGDAGPRPEVVSPYEFLQTKRGVGNAISAAKWNRDITIPLAAFKKVFTERWRINSMKRSRSLLLSIAASALLSPRANREV